jgi:glycosyltransferase involved in cell wall biosynthesis
VKPPIPLDQTTPLLMLPYHFPPENTTGAARPFRFYRYLPEFGYQPYVVTAGHPDPASPRENVWHVPNRFLVPSRTTLAGITEMALRKFLFPTDEGQLWTRSAVAAAEKVVRQHSIGAVYSTAPPFTSHIAAMKLKQKLGLKWIADFRDPLVGNPFRVLDGLPARVDQCLERRIFRNADALIAVTDTIGEEWARRYPAVAAKIHIIWNGFDPDEAFPEPAVSPGPRRVLSHVGGAFGGREPTQILQSIDRLIAKSLLNPAHILVRMIGYLEPGIVEQNLALFNRLKEQGCLEYGGGKVRRSQALQNLVDSDYLLLLDGNQLGIGYTVPAKLYEYVRAGRPILASTQHNSPVDRIVPNCGVRYGMIYLDDSAEQTDRKMMEFLALPSEPVSPSRWFFDTFDGRSHAGMLASIVDSLLGVAPGAAQLAREV